MEISQIKIIESLDSLWFFTNIFSPKSRPRDENPTEILPQESVKKEAPKPISPILLIQQNEPRNAEIDPEIENSGEVNMEMVEMEFPKPARRRRRRRREKRLNQRRKIVGELELGFDMEIFEEILENQRFGDENYEKNYKMPPLNDGMAMKEHLKSWAYAVACTVR